uniref:Uncharacterized protein n=1 Tax=Arundo donax TaxID=35708 RepID=A0A0A9FUH6_ARUDO
MNKTRPSPCPWNSCTLQKTSVLLKLVGTPGALTVPSLFLSGTRY